MSIVPFSLNQINELTQGNQIGTGVQFDLNDDTFANILGDKLNQFDGNQEIFTQLMGPIGVPIGMSIEGLTDDPFKVSAIDSSSLGELSLNQSEVNGNDENIIKSAGQRVDNLIDLLNNGSGSVSITDVLQMRDSKVAQKFAQAQDEFSNGFGNFMKKQAANMYGHVGKNIANNIGDILSAM